MKSLLLAILFVGLSMKGYPQSQDETEVRKYDALELEAFLKTDTVALSKLWSPMLVVNNPYNKVVTLDQIKALIRKQKITQVKFVREIEKLTINENIAIVMGKETPDVSSATPGAPKNLFLPRRVTNIWMKKAGTWMLVGRQATNIGN